MIKAIIEANVNEDKYSVYNSIYDLKTLSEYYSKLLHTSKTKFVKFIRFTGAQAAIYNISDILVSPNVSDNSEGKKKVQIIYSGDEASKVWDIKKFSTVCKKIFEAVKDSKPEDVEVEAILDGQNKPTKFRFYYDSDNGFAILVNGTNTKGLEEFLNNYEGDLINTVSVPKVTKAPKISTSKPRIKKSNPHDGYVCIDSSDSFGHKIKIWKKDPDYKPEDYKKASKFKSKEISQDKGVAKIESEMNEAIDIKCLPIDKKDKILSTIVAIASDIRNADIDESEFFTNIMRVLDDNDLLESLMTEAYDKPFLHDTEDNGPVTNVRQLKSILNNFKDSDILDFCDKDGEPGYQIKAIWNSNMEYEMTGSDDGRDNVCYIRISE